VRTGHGRVSGPPSAASIDVVGVSHLMGEEKATAKTSTAEGAAPNRPPTLTRVCYLRAVTCTLDANKALLDRPARTDGWLPRARLYVARCGGGRRARRLGAGGKAQTEADVQHGLGNAPATLRRLFEGRNEGKQLLRVAQ
jgi:hypothetical protein